VEVTQAEEIRFDGGPSRALARPRTWRQAISHRQRRRCKLVEDERQDLIPRAGFGGVKKFEQAFTAIASTKGRLEDEDGKSLRDLERENEILRTLIADVLLENARLRRVS
jgi:hypothetical protein